MTKLLTQYNAHLSSASPLPDFCEINLHPVHGARTLLVSLLFPEYVQHPPALGPLHLLFSLPRKQTPPPSGSAQIAPSTAYLECVLKLRSTDGKQQKAV